MGVAISAPHIHKHITQIVIFIHIFISKLENKFMHQLASSIYAVPMETLGVLGVI